MTQILDGKLVGLSIRQGIKEKVADYQLHHGRRPGLAVILVGDDPASHIYVRNKQRACEKAGIFSRTIQLTSAADTPAVVQEVHQANQDPAIHGILVQMPLPPHVNVRQVLAAIDPAKDVDGLTTENLGRLSQGEPGLFACTPRGVIALLDYYNIPLVGCRALVVGRSVLVGKPLGLLLLGRDATVTMAHSRSRNLPELVHEADLVVAAVGRPEMIRGDWIRPGAAVIDVGINRMPSGIVGDVAFREAWGRADWITPVPGGVGPMTIAMLLDNTWKAFVRQEDKI